MHESLGHTAALLRLATPYNLTTEKFLVLCGHALNHTLQLLVSLKNL